jgi:RimJ/RimL family protein N-acetyltransferase
MFARTERLLLRPGFAEDAPMLAAAIADEQVVRHLSATPWPFGVKEARDFLDRLPDAGLPRMLITERVNEGARVVGACGLGRRPSGAVELGYWISRPHWGRGFATEAGRALIDIARTLRLPQLEAAHFADNPASARVLEKLGFRPTGLRAARASCAREGEAEVRFYRMSLSARGGGQEPLAA